MVRGLEFRSNGNGTCKLVVNSDSSHSVLNIPEKSPEGEAVVSIFLNSMEVEEFCVSDDNPYYKCYEGVLFDKNMETLIWFPPKKGGKFIVPSSVRKVAEGALENWKYCLEEIIFQDGLIRVDDYSLYGSKRITLPTTLTSIGDNAFSGYEYMWDKPIIRAPRNSIAHRFAIEKGYTYMPSDCIQIWDDEGWMQRFNSQSADYHGLRREVWENTRAIVEDGGYSLSDGNSVVFSDNRTKRYSQFYYQPFRASFERLNASPEITVVADDCLDVAHKWVEEVMCLSGECNDIAVLNMANRRNPGGGVTNGAGAQEEYLFRCSDYHKFLYRYAHYAEQYNVTRSHYQYPLDKNFGGIFSENVTIFRENESMGYRLIPKPWKVNMIAVAGMNSPRLIIENGEERIAPELVEGIKNKIRTIFRIACDRGQKKLVLGALGCGAFHNPPKHIAEIFRDVLCEKEFFCAFNKICFAVKTSHISRGDTNFSAFKEILDGFVPVLKPDPPNKVAFMQIKKIAVARDSYALLMSNGQVRIVDIQTGKSQESRRFRKSIDIAAGFHHIIGLHEDGNAVFKSVGSQAPSFNGIKLFGGCAVYACELHSAMLRFDRTVACVDHLFDTGLEKMSKKSSPSELMAASQRYMQQSSLNEGIPKYADIVSSWHNIKQVALTFEEPYGLTFDGKILCGDHELDDFQSFFHGKIVQIDAFGCYYSSVTIAALYEDGTVKARYANKDITSVSDWNNVRKICCGNHAAVIGLTNEGKMLISDGCRYYDRQSNEVKYLENIVDIAANFEHLIALSRNGEVIYLCAK